MGGLFQGLELGKRALLTHQLSLQTIGHNIANVDTPGYRRQRVNTVAADPEHNANYTIGAGVTATDIRHIRDYFLGDQYRKESRSLGQWTYKEKILSQIEAQFGEPGDNSLSALLNDFWAAWESVARGDQGSRASLLEQTRLLLNGFHELAGSLQDLQTSIDRDLVAMTTKINGLSAEIADLNNQIKQQEIGGAAANDLRDIRDQRINELASIIDVNTHEASDGTMIVYIGAMSLVDHNTYLKLDTASRNVNGQLRHQLVWQGTTINVRNLNGELKGLIDSRDDTIPQYLDKLNELARALVEQVNTIHNTGYGATGSTNVDFFDPRYTEAATIRLNSALTNDTNLIAASQTGDAGDTRTAKAIANLRDTRMLNRNTVTMNEYYSGLVGGLGVESHQAQAFAENYQLLLNQTESAQLSVEGVSLDEEMADMVKYQHAYDAAARIITTMDQALDTVVNNMGIVGR